MRPGKRQPARERAEHLGRRAETFAAWLLRLKGYQIIARRYRSPVGEIDLVARRSNLVTFVEVKARASRAEAAASITPHQRQRILRAAEHFLATNPVYQSLDVRFDAILIRPRRWPLHLVDAWRS